MSSYRWPAAGRRAMQLEKGLVIPPMRAKSEQGGKGRQSEV